jgi:hypothetical protein
LGSNFDDFLKEEGLLVEAETVAIKRLIAFQIAQLMESSSVSKICDAKPNPTFLGSEKLKKALSAYEGGKGTVRFKMRSDLGYPSYSAALRP